MTEFLREKVGIAMGDVVVDLTTGIQLYVKYIRALDTDNPIIGLVSSPNKGRARRVTVPSLQNQKKYLIIWRDLNENC